MAEQVLALPVPAQSRRAPDDVDSSPLAALLAAADADADALADSVHDGALQALVVARYAADAAVRGGDPALARDAVQEALVMLRRAVWLLRPRGGDGLPAALAELSTRTTEPLQLDLDDAVAAALTPAARGLAYRFVQSCTDASTVTLWREGGFAVVAADGELANPSGWTARAAAIGGRIDLSGGSARLLLPLPDLDPEGDR